MESKAEVIRLSTLPEVDYSQLANVHDGFQPDPRHSISIVAKDEAEQIIGRVFLLAPTHVEGPWVEEKYRSLTVGKRLMDAAEHVAKAHGISKVFAYATNDELAGYLKRLGYEKWEVTVWTKEI